MSRQHLNYNGNVRGWGAMSNFNSEASAYSLRILASNENQGIITKSGNGLICLNILRTWHSAWH